MVEQGQLSGVERVGVQQFLGVPFAAPPTGPLRWQPPRPPIWRGNWDATKFGAACAQGNPVSGSEDCLTLNIYRPPEAKNAPLMVWIHGGFFTGGDASIFDGSALARQYGVVVVTVNYRLGPFGFLPIAGVTDGNLGLYDVLAAVRWLRQNAFSIGADPNNVTLFGQSAGAAAICTLMTAPSARGLFHKAILQSGSCASSTFYTPLNTAQRVGLGLVRGLRCDGGDVATCLRGKTTAEVAAVRLAGRSLIDPVPLPPVYGDALIPLAPPQAFEQNRSMNIPLLLGSNREEGQIFEPYIPPLLRNSRLIARAGTWLLLPDYAVVLGQRYPQRNGEAPIRSLMRLITDDVFACPTSWLAGKVARRMPTYFYEFSDPRPPLSVGGQVSGEYGAYHGSELVYVMETPIVGLAQPENFTPAQAKLATQMGEYWTSFARSGQPAALGLTQWPPYNLAMPRVMALEPAATALKAGFAGEHQCDFWNAIDGRK